MEMAHKNEMNTATRVEIESVFRLTYRKSYFFPTIYFFDKKSDIVSLIVIDMGSGYDAAPLEPEPHHERDPIPPLFVN